MQKNKANASILIWSIFLSLILSISFIGISNQISDSIVNNGNYINKNNDNIILQNKLKSKDYSDQSFPESNEKIIFMQNRNYNGSIKKDEKIKFKFEQTSDISINIINGGPISYITYGKNGNETSSGITKLNTSINNLSGSIQLINLAGYTTFKLNSSTNFIAPSIKYKIVKTIGNKDVIKSKGTIQNN